MNDPRQRNASGQGPARLSGRAWWITLIVVLLFNLVFYPMLLRANEEAQRPRIAVAYSTFLDQVRANNVRTAQFSGSTVSGDFAKPYKDPKSGKSYPRYITTLLLPVQDPALVELLKSHKVQISAVNQ